MDRKAGDKRVSISPDGQDMPGHSMKKGRRAQKPCRMHPAHDSTEHDGYGTVWKPYMM